MIFNQGTDMNRRNFFARGLKTALTPVAALAAVPAVASVVAPIADSPRKSLHIQCGDADWNPTQEELNSIASMFSAATLDPAGSIVVTRNSFQLTEFEALAKLPITVTPF